MPDPRLVKAFERCRNYQQARAWKKPLLDPVRFFANQLRKRGFLRRQPGALRKAAAFHLAEFTIIEEEGVSQEILSYGLFEAELTEALMRLIQPGQIVLDIGMHLGYYATLFAVLVGERGQVHAFEPTPSTRQAAAHNTQLFPQLTVHPFAVWSSAKTLELRDYGWRCMAFNTLLQPTLEAEPAAPKTISVNAIALDEFRASLAPDDKIGLIKIDAESAEREIIAGAARLLRQDQPILSVEVGDRLNASHSRSLIADLDALRYQPWEIRAGQFYRHAPQESYRYGNLIFVPGALDPNRVAASEGAERS